MKLEQFAQQNRKRLRRLENMQHAKNQVGKRKQAEKAWNNESKRLENIRRRLERKKEIERRRKKTEQDETKIALKQQASTKSKLAFLETKREAREDTVVKKHEQKRPLKIFRDIEKQQTQQRRIYNVPILEEKTQADYRKGGGQFREQELERCKITKIARKLLTQAKSDRMLQVKDKHFVNNCNKVAAKIASKNMELRKDVEHAKNEDFKERPRLEWINTLRLRKPKEETFRPGCASVPCADFDAKESNSRVQAAASFAIAVVNTEPKSKNILCGGYDAYDETVFQMGGTSASRVQAAIIFDRKSQSAITRRDRNSKNLPASFPALSKTRPEFREVLTPLRADKSRAWSSKETKMSSTSPGLLPVVLSSTIE